MNRLNRRVLPLVIVGTLSWGHWSGAATFNIANGDVASLINAINIANSNNEGDTIILAANGTYVLTTVDNTTYGPSGLPVIINDNQHVLVFASNGSTIKRDVNAPAFRIFTIFNSLGNQPYTVSMANVTINNGLGAVSGGFEAFGGGIYNSGTLLLLQNCTISGNHAGAGGGIYNADATADLTNCTISGNSGGGIWNQNPFASSRGGTVHLTNCTLSGNTIAAQAGAAINNLNTGGTSNQSRVDLTGCTLNSNGIYDLSDHFYSQVTLRSCILNQCPLLSEKTNGGTGGIFSFGYNLSNDDGSGKLTQATDQVSIDPGLDPLGLQNNGGPTQTIALTWGSAAIDKGKSFGATTDQRGVTRPYDNPSIANASGGDGSDIGAYEVGQGVDPVQGGTGFVVTTTDDHDDGVCGGADCTLREAVARANTVPGQSPIGFAHTLTGAITLTQGEIAVTDSITITGIPIGTISGNGASRIFNFSGGSSSLFGLTIRDGFNQINNFLGQTNTGGGIYNSATLGVYGCSFINNRVVGGLNGGAANGGKGEGGAIYNSGTLLVDGSVFSQSNQASGGGGGNGNFGHGGVPSGSGGAGQGGAIFNDTTGSLGLTNSTFNQNMANGGNGGSGGPLGGNGGKGDGGAIYNLGAMTVKSATITGNSGSGGAAGTGTTNGVVGAGSGGVIAGGGTTTVANTIVAGNTGNNGGAQDVGGAFTSSGYNLIGIGDFSTGFNAIGDQVGTTAAPINALLGPLQNNGGATSTMLPQTGSPALDRGFAFGLTNDQRGRSRPFDDPAILNAPSGDGSDVGAVEIGSGPAPTVVVSRKIHDGVSQFFDIALSSDTLGDECRSGGANGNYTLIFSFASPVTFTSASVCAGVGIVGSATASSNQVTVNLSGVTAAEVLNICLSNVNDGTTSGNVSYPFRVLVGDTTGNGSVNASDVSLTKLKSGQAVDASNFREDVTVNNSINASDVSLVKSKSGTALPP